MKPFKFIPFIMTLAAWLPSTQADVVPFPQDGDLFMGFHSPNATNEYLSGISGSIRNSTVNLSGIRS